MDYSSDSDNEDTVLLHSISVGISNLFISQHNKRTWLQSNIISDEDDELKPPTKIFRPITPNQTSTKINYSSNGHSTISSKSKRKQYKLNRMKRLRIENVTKKEENNVTKDFNSNETQFDNSKRRIPLMIMFPESDSEDDNNKTEMQIKRKKPKSEHEDMCYQIWPCPMDVNNHLEKDKDIELFKIL